MVAVITKLPTTPKMKVLRAIARQKWLHFQYRTACYLVARLNGVDFLHIPQWEIADDTGMSQSLVSQALGALVNRGLLEEGDPIGPGKTYRLVLTFGKAGD